MFKKTNILYIAILTILLVEGGLGYSSYLLNENVTATISTLELNKSIANNKYQLFQNSIQNNSDNKLSSTSKEDKQFEFIDKVINNKASNLYDYSNSSLVISSLLFSDKYIKLQQQFDEKSLLDVSENKLSNDEKKYKKLLVMISLLENLYEEKYKSFMNNDLRRNILSYKNHFGILSSTFQKKFVGHVNFYENELAFHKLQKTLISPDHYEALVQHFEENKTFSRKDLQSINANVRNSKNK